ncbi:MAG: hypothetical protein AAF557_16400 [Pseudomonadota bacterium]
MNVVALHGDNGSDAPVDSARARLMMQDPNIPVQLTLPAKDAALLAYITDEFARHLAPRSVEGDQLVDDAAKISNLLSDCLLARGGI